MTKVLKFVLKQMHAMSSCIEKRHENVYVIHIDEIVLNNESCLIANDVNDS